MDHATIFVGFDPECGAEPVVKADGRLIGTVQQVREFISKWEEAYQSQPTDVDRLKARMDEMDRTFKERVVTVVQDAARRRVIA